MRFSNIIVSVTSEYSLNVHLCVPKRHKVKKLIEPELTVFGPIILIFTKKLDNVSHGHKPVVFCLIQDYPPQRSSTSNSCLFVFRFALYDLVRRFCKAFKWLAPN